MLAWALVALAGAARADVEVRLTTGGVLRGLRAERTGDHVTLFSASGNVRLAASKVVSITEIAGDAPNPASRLNVERESAASGHAVVTEPALTSSRPFDAWMRVPEMLPAMARRDLTGAERAARSAAAARPSDPAPVVALGEVLLAQARHGEAADALQRVALSGLDAGLRTSRDLALAEAFSRLNRVDDACRVLDQSPADASGRIERARAELEPDLPLGQRPFGSSAHFVLVGPPGSRPRDMEALLQLAETVHAELSRELGGAPEDRITVLLHPGTEFWESTGQGADVAALYDGRMRIPAGRISPISDALTNALRHEMTHAFVEALSGGRADARWHEGIAEHFEGSDARPAIRALAAHARRQGAEWPPPVTHATSHARLEWFLSRWGMSGLRDVLAGMVSRGTIDAAVRAATGLGEAGLDAAWRQDLVSETP